MPRRYTAVAARPAAAPVRLARSACPLCGAPSDPSGNSMVGVGPLRVLLCGRCALIGYRVSELAAALWTHFGAARLRAAGAQPAVGGSP